MTVHKALIAVAVTAVPVSVHAQEADSAPTSGLEDIVITAQRRAENLQKVPLSVVALTSDTLADRHFTDPAQLQFLAPNLQFTSFTLAPGATNFSVRGIGTSSFSHKIEPSVATVIDGIALSRPEMGVMQFVDLERVEILAGPQGMLFGKNASAGLINIITTRPKIGKTEFKAHAELGFVNAATKCCNTVFQATGNLPMGDSAALRINAFHVAYDELVQDRVKVKGSNYGHSEYGFRAKFLWEPSDALSVYISGDYAHGDGIGTGATTVRTVAPGSPLIPFQLASNITPGPKNLVRSANGRSNVVFDVYGVQSEIGYMFANGISITNILGYRKYDGHHVFDADFHQISFLDLAEAWFDFDQITEEIRISSPSGGAFEYQVGGFLYWGHADRADFSTGNLNIGPPPPGKLDWIGFDGFDNVKSRSYAIYGQAGYKLTDAFKITAGGRYTWDRLTNDLLADGSLFQFPFTPDFNYTQKTRANDFSWRVSAQYDVTDRIMAYATASTGYKGPGSTWATQAAGQSAPNSPRPMRSA